MSSRHQRERLKPSCHINLLKPYYVREEVACPHAAELTVLAVDHLSCGDLSSTDYEEAVEPEDCIMCPQLSNLEILRDLPSFLKHLPTEKHLELAKLIQEYPSLFSDIPTQPHVVQHDIVVGESLPIRQRFYRVPWEKKKTTRVRG